jgi:signal peptidase I
MIGEPEQNQAVWVPPGKPRRRPGRVIFWVLAALSAALLVAGIGLGVATMRQYFVPSVSMEKTLQPSDRLLVILGTDVRRGDIIIFRKPATAASPADGLFVFVKRLIGLPGDHVACCDAKGRVTVNGKPLDETYVDPAGPPSQFRFSVTLVPGQIWVLGDNRNVSLDSRAWGPVPASGIIGYVSVVERGASATRLRTPQTFVADGLAPPDTRLAPYVLVFALVFIGILALLVLAVIGVIRFAIRRSRSKRHLPAGYATYGPS